jgi:RNA polymerase sigma factor (sigma-70 family)
MSETRLPAPPSKRQFVEEHYALIVSTVRWVCVRFRCFDSDADDFQQEVFRELLQGSALERFRHQCSEGTFLSTVITNMFRDFRIAQWGKWRPSARAIALGSAAVKLETLLVRDGLFLEEAIEVLATDAEVSENAQDLRNLAEKLPPRVCRRWVGDSDLLNRPASTTADESVRRDEHAKRRARISAVATAAVNELPPDDQLLLEQRHEHGGPVSQLARERGIPQRQLYTRFDRIYRTLRKALLAAGVSPEEAREVLGNWMRDIAPDDGEASDES